MSAVADKRVPRARQPRAAPAPTRNQRPQTSRARTGAAPYVRKDENTTHMANASVTDVANSAKPILKVKGESVAKTVAGAICNVIRESKSGQAPSILATGPAAINVAMKSIAIARKYLMDEATPVDLICTPVFTQDVRSGSNVTFECEKVAKIGRQPMEDDLAAKDKTDVFKLAGAIAGRLRDGQEVSVTTKGAIPVLIAVKSIALAQDYVADEARSIQFTPALVDLENPEIRNETSTYVHFAIITK